MTAREIREELMAITKELESYEFVEVDESAKDCIERGPLQEAFGLVSGGVSANGFLVEEFGERLQKIEKALKDLWLIT